MSGGAKGAQWHLGRNRSDPDSVVGWMSSLLVKEVSFVEAPSSSVVQVEVAICAEVLAGKELAVRAGHQTRKLFVCEFVELFWGDRLPNPEFS
jgi:hypothetical protein